MQIHLTQNEITAAVKSFIAQQGINLLGRDVSVEFTAGRKENGLTAEVMIGEVEAVFAETFDPNQVGADIIPIPDMDKEVTASTAVPATLVAPDLVPRGLLFGTN